MLSGPGRQATDRETAQDEILFAVSTQLCHDFRVLSHHPRWRHTNIPREDAGWERYADFVIALMLKISCLACLEISAILASHTHF